MRYRVYEEKDGTLTPLCDARSEYAARMAQADLRTRGYRADIWDFKSNVKLSNVQLIVAEIERRWRARTPAKRIDEVLPGSRVGKGEMRLWCQRNGIEYNEFDPKLSIELDKMFRRLRKEFPEERWERGIPKWRRVMEA